MQENKQINLINNCLTVYANQPNIEYIHTQHKAAIMQSFFSGKTLKTMGKSFDDFVVRFTKTTQTVEFSTKNRSTGRDEIIQSARIDFERDTNLNGCWINMYASEQLRFFLDSLKPNDRVKFLVEDNLNDKLYQVDKGNSTVQNLYAYIERDVKGKIRDNVKVYKVLIDSQYMTGSWIIAPVNTGYFERMKNVS